jgi:hypothetical protein
LAVSEGVKVTSWLAVPAFGAVEDGVKANAPATTVPFTLALPFSELLANVCPKVIALAERPGLIVGVALVTVTLTLVVAVL